MSPTVSVIVPVYNVEKYLNRCIESIRSQSLNSIEIILVDDGSTDDSPRICDDYLNLDYRIKVIHKSNEGLGLARNAGLELAQGEFVAFIDSDDYIKSTMMEELYNRACASNSDAVISGGFITVKYNGDILIEKDIDSEKIYENDVEKIALEMLGAPPEYYKDCVYEMSVCKGLYRLELINNNNIKFLSERQYISEDLFFHFDFFRYARKAIIVPEVYYYYCEHLSSLTKHYQKDRFTRNVYLYCETKKILVNLDFGNDTYLYADRMLISRARVAISHIVSQYRLFNSQAKTEISEICNSQELKELLLHYPINKLPFKQRVFTKQIKKGNWFILYLLAFANSFKNR